MAWGWAFEDNDQIAADAAAQAAAKRTRQAVRPDNLVPGSYPWHPDKLNAALSDPVLGPELQTAFQPTREALRAQHGDTVPVFRYSGGAPEGAKPHPLLSFTMDRRTAERMSGAAPKPAAVYSDADIAAKEAEFAKGGEVKIGNHTLKKGDGGYVDIFDRDGGHVTDTGSVREYMQQRNQWAAEDNADRAARLAKVGEHRIPVGDIVAATDRAGQQEIIARNSMGLYSNKTDAKTGAAVSAPAREAVAEFSDQLKQKHGLSHLGLYPTHAGDLNLSMLEVPKGMRKQGVGSAAMQDIVDYADRSGMRLTLTPALKDERHGTTSRSRLVDFYKRFGFVENKGCNKDFAISEGMYRKPKRAPMSLSPKADE